MPHAFLLLVLLAGPARAAVYASAEALVDAAMSANAGVQARAFEGQAARDEAQAAGRMPDPTLGAELMVPEHPPDPGQASMTDMRTRLRVEARQAFPLPGVLGAERAAMIAMIPVARGREAEARLQLARELHRAWWELVGIRGERRLMEASVGRLRSMEAAMNSRFEVGEEGAAALLRLQLVLGRMEDELGEMARMEGRMLAMLGRSLPEGPPDLVTPVEVEAIEADEELEALLALAAQARPALAVEAAMADQARAQARMARAEARVMPMLMGSVELRFSEELERMYSVGVESPLPFSAGASGRARQDAALARARAAELDRAEMETMIAAELAGVQADWQRSAQKARVYAQTLVPLAQAARDSRLSAYRVGRAELDAVLDAEMALLELERDRFLAAVSTRIARVEVDALTGTLTGERHGPEDREE